MHDSNAYGLWPLVILNSLVFIFFAFSFTKPKRRSSASSLGALAKPASSNPKPAQPERRDS